jgi:cell migration-inducing and hyaluronan-binding protein
VNTTFRNYQDNATRKTGAISHLLYTSFGASSNNAVEKLSFENAKPVYYPPMEKKWGNDNNAGSLAYKTAVFTDRDGSLGLGTSSFVVIHDGVNNSIAVDDEACEIKPSWNAAVCKGDVGRMSFVNGRGLGFDTISGGFAPNDDQRPVILSRAGQEISIPVGTNVRAGIEFKATTERTELELHMIEPRQTRVHRCRAWMRCAQPPTLLTIRPTMHCGSNSSPPVTAAWVGTVVV